MHPDAEFEAGGEEDERGRELMHFLTNAVIFWRRGGFDANEITSFADLSTFGDYLLDMTFPRG